MHDYTTRPTAFSCQSNSMSARSGKTLIFGRVVTFPIEDVIIGSSNIETGFGNLSGGQSEGSTQSSQDAELSNHSQWQGCDKRWTAAAYCPNPSRHTTQHLQPPKLSNSHITSTCSESEHGTRIYNSRQEISSRQLTSLVPYVLPKVGVGLGLMMPGKSPGTSPAQRSRTKRKNGNAKNLPELVDLSSSPLLGPSLSNLAEDQLDIENDGSVLAGTTFRSKRHKNHINEGHLHGSSMRTSSFAPPSFLSSSPSTFPHPDGHAHGPHSTAQKVFASVKSFKDNLYDMESSVGFSDANQDLNSLRRYHNSEQPLQDFGPGPDSHATTIESPLRYNSNMGYHGGPRPRNTLQGNNSVAKDIPRPITKAFDLVEAHKRDPSRSPPAKKQKLSQSMGTMAGSSPGKVEMESKNGRTIINLSQSSKDSYYGIPGQARMSSRKDSSTSLFGTEEYSNLEEMMLPTGGNVVRGPKRGSEPQQNKQASRVTIYADSRKPVYEVEGDEVQDSGPDSHYRGNALRLPPRSGRFPGFAVAQELSTSNEKSPYFEKSGTSKASDSRTLPSRASSAFKTQSAPSQRASSSGGAQSRGGPILAADADTDDDSVQQIETMETHHDGRRNSMRESAKSDSISSKGNITPTRFGTRSKNSPGSKKLLRLNDNATYELHYIQEGPFRWPPLGESVQKSYLEFDSKQEEFHTMLGGNNTSSIRPGLTIQPQKISKIFCNPESGRTVLYRAKRVDSSGTLLLNLGTGDQIVKFLQHLQSLNSSIDIVNKSIIYLEKTFAHQSIQAGVTSDLYPKNRLSIDAANASQQRAETVDGTDSLPGNYPAERKRIREVLGLLEDDDEEEPRFQKPNTQVADEKPRRITRTATRTSEGRSQDVRRSPPRLRGWTELNPGWKQFWKVDTLLFPPQGLKRASVDSADVERLDEGEFLNDNLVAFYLRYLEFKLEQSQPEIAKRVYFLNTFFYQKLTKTKGKSSIDYDGVKRWTAKVDLFSYDYLIVPVNEHTHWYLAIICNAPKLLSPVTEVPQPSSNNDDQEDKAPPDSLLDLGVADQDFSSDTPSETKVSSSFRQMSLDENISVKDQEWPTQEDIPHSSPPFSKKSISPKIDTGPRVNKDDVRESTAISTNGVVEVQSTITKKGRPRQSLLGRKYDPSEPRIITLDSLGVAHSPTCMNLKAFLIAEAKERHNVTLTSTTLGGMTAKEIPQQDNFCDCGVFLLGYVEQFLESPDTFVQKVLQREMDAVKDWPSMQAPKMRAYIRNLILELQQKQADRETKLRTKKKAEKARMRKEQSSQLTEGEERPIKLKASVKEAISERSSPDHSESEAVDAAASVLKNQPISGRVPKMQESPVLAPSTKRKPLVLKPPVDAEHVPANLEADELSFPDQPHPVSRRPLFGKLATNDKQRIRKSEVIDANATASSVESKRTKIKKLQVRSADDDELSHSPPKSLDFKVVVDNYSLTSSRREIPVSQSREQSESSQKLAKEQSTAWEQEDILGQSEKRPHGSGRQQSSPSSIKSPASPRALRSSPRSNSGRNRSPSALSRKGPNGSVRQNQNLNTIELD